MTTQTKGLGNINRYKISKIAFAVLVTGVVGASSWHYVDYKANSEMMISNLEVSVQDLSEDRDSLWDQLEETNDFLIESNKTIQDKEEVISNLKEEISDLEAKVEKRDSRISQLQSQLETAKSNSTQTSSSATPKVAEEKTAVAQESSKPTETSKPEGEPSLPSAEPVESSKGELVGSFEATAYAVGDGLTPSTVTANGTDVANTIHTKNGHRIIAADTSVLPMNSLVKVELPDGDSFTARVSDTGSAINGQIIDILMDSPSRALSFGRQNGIRVYKIN